MTLITAAEIQKGDLIRVTNTEQQEDRKNTCIYEGVAVHEDSTFDGKPVWRTEKRNNFWVHEEGAVIELLDRPKPKIVLPTGIGAVVEYTVNFDSYYPKRTALRALDGSWKCYNDLGQENDDYPNNKDFAEFLEEDNFAHTVLFEGVAK